ncbi:alpha/beta hydrolase [Streptomyces sp. SM13]|uniref:alpha/beta hydrolase n=1 Tax=Streptomyces sp. SM13 TaxID=1983803 RepID=UPI000CD51AC0|nr:alpha/beta hydrolase [Streptomyces sp. SM13]
MKPRLVFVHGVGDSRDAKAEEDEWLRALANGARRAGQSRRISALVSGWGSATSFAYYGDLFKKPGAQGGADSLGAGDAAVVGELLLEAISDHLAAPGLASQEKRVLLHARAQLAPAGQSQGLGNIGRRTLNALTTLMSAPGLRWFGGIASSQLTLTILGQVARYLNRGESDAAGISLDRRIRERVAGYLGQDGPTVVVAHSLGTVVALEALHEHKGDIPLFVTLGSPLGMRTAVLPRTRPQPMGTPETVGRWLNFWDRDDVIAARPMLEHFVLPNTAGVGPVSDRVDSDGLWVHSAAKYLAHPAIAGPVVEALDTLAGQ